jgi:dUTP pyrophosphatase
MFKLKVKKLHPDAKLPTKAHASDAAFDLYLYDEGYWQSHDGVYILKTGIAVEIPEGYYGQIAGRSSLGKKGYVVLGGVVDSSYRGEVSVMLARMHEPASPSTLPSFVFTPGDRIAQLLILPVPQVEVVEVDELSSSERGTGGFGSTGK